MEKNINSNDDNVPKVILNKNGIYDKQIFRPFIENLYSWKLCMGRKTKTKEILYGHWTLSIAYAIYNSY